MKVETTRNIFSSSQAMLGWPRIVTAAGNGESHPPRNMMEHSVEMSHMFAYSARKKMANAMPEYLTWNPATLSDSPSATSKGARFVSATPETRYVTKSGKSGTTNQLSRP